MSPIFLGCAGWNLPREHWPRFSPEGTHLRRYGLGLNAVEINSSFYRPHRPQTYARWAQSVPSGFRFSVKVPRLLTHELRLQGGDEQLDEFLGQCGQLGANLGCLLVQLPPSLSYEPVIASAFFGALRERFDGDVVLEPRHDSWLAAEPLLLSHRIGRVAADPAVIARGDTPAGWPGVRYWRLHGSPRIYHSAYPLERLQALAKRLQASAQEGAATWCIFDNTASGHAVSDALTLQGLLAEQGAG